MEMDAASRTGVNDIRELIDGVRYRPTSARYKIYIIDEVHMLSTNAFNALLKTLEEPPQHVKFIFATTEIRKIPVTVLSRCQRFDLRRVEMTVLQEHFARIAEKEGAEIAPAALAMIARAADGSVRDGLSLLDQAISHGAGLVSEEQVREMLGLADRARVFDLYQSVMKGDVKAALDEMAAQYAVGADPAVVLQDMLELTHWLTRLKVAPDHPELLATASETERVRGREMSRTLSMAVLTRSWQMLLKGLTETRMAPTPLQAAEMLLVRLSYAADLPTPAEAIARMKDGGPPAGPSAPSPGGGGGGGGMAHAVGQGGGMGGAVPVHAPMMQTTPQVVAMPAMPASFKEAVALFVEHKEGVLSAMLSGSVHLVHFEPGRIEFRPQANTPGDLAQRVGRLLSEWTGRRWMVTASNQPGQPTLREQGVAAEQQRREDAAAHPLVQAVLAAFPGATIEAVRDLAGETVDDEDGAAALELGATDADLTMGEDD